MAVSNGRSLSDSHTAILYRFIVELAQDSRSLSVWSSMLALDLEAPAYLAAAISIQLISS